MSVLEPIVEGITLPSPNAISQPFWDGTAEGELRFQRCDRCEHPNFGPGVACRRCQSRNLTWEASAGVGELYSWTLVGRGPTPAWKRPYVPIIVRLGEGYDMVSALIDCDAEVCQPGLALSVRFHRATPEIVLPFFAPTR